MTTVHRPATTQPFNNNVVIRFGRFFSSSFFLYVVSFLHTHYSFIYFELTMHAATTDGHLISARACFLLQRRSLCSFHSNRSIIHFAKNITSHLNALWDRARFEMKATCTRSNHEIFLVNASTLCLNCVRTKGNIEQQQQQQNVKWMKLKKKPEFIAYYVTKILPRTI